MSQFDSKVVLLFVRFEQARGTSGVPKTWVPYMVGHPRNPQALPEMKTLVRMAVDLFRAACLDANQGHGRDLMPPGYDDYSLHDIDGGKVEKAEQIKWRQPDGVNRAELVLVWRDPATDFLEKLT